jgi:hypothetical protein
MKKIFFTLTILAAFGMFCFVGFQIAAHSDSQSLLPINRPSPVTIDARQSNLLLILVDRIDLHKPILRAVWFVIRFHSESQTVLSFSRIYPDSQPDRNTDIENAFSLGSSSEPSAVFFHKMSDYKISQDGYILIDEQGLDQLTRWLDPQGLQVGSNDVSGMLHLGCSFFAGPKDTQAPSFDWGAFSGHTSSNIVFNDILAEWSLLVSAQPPTRCQFPAQ